VGERLKSLDTVHNETCTERFTDLDKLNLIKFYYGIGFWLKPIIEIVPTASKNDARFKSG